MSNVVVCVANDCYVSTYGKSLENSLYLPILARSASEGVRGWHTNAALCYQRFPSSLALRAGMNNPRYSMKVYLRDCRNRPDLVNWRII
jgi:hypothetical protein